LIEGVRDSGVTVVLVTHYMDEAERLCDRLAIIDRGRVVATDTPAGLIGGVEAGATLRLRTVPPLDAATLRDLPGVRAATTEGEELVVQGEGDLLHTVVTRVHAADAVVVSARLGQTTLVDAFLALTGRDRAPASLRTGALPGEGAA